MAITWNSTDKGTGVVLSNNNLTVSKNSSTGNWNDCSVRTTIGKTFGKWYWEIKLDKMVIGSGINIGVSNLSSNINNYAGYNSYSIGYSQGGYLLYNNISNNYGQSYIKNDVVGIAIDLDDPNGKLEFFINGVSQGIADSNLKSKISGAIFPTVSIYSSSEGITANFTGPFSAIPNGYLPFDIPWYYGRVKSNISDMQVGDVIPCRYTALTSGVAGYFSELGTCTASEIPLSGTATPDGLFYFIMVGYDSQGRKKLVADRNIQTNISWDILNTAGICSGLFSTYTNNLVPVMTSTTAPSGVVSSSGDLGAGYESWRVFSQTTAYWKSNSSICWLKYMFPIPTNIVRYTITMGSDMTSTYPKNWTFEGSNDNSNWVILDTQTNITSVAAEKKAFILTNTNSYLYYRINISANNGYSGMTEIKAIEMMGPMSNHTIRLMTGGISSTDTDNEWDKIIVGSTLNGTITAGDNNVWNWNKGCSITSTRVGNYCVYRGYGPINFWTGGNTTSYTASDYAYRPIMLIESVKANSLYMIQQGLNLYNINPNNYTVNPSLISDLQIAKTLSEGQSLGDTLDDDTIESNSNSDWSSVKSFINLFKGTKYKILKFNKVA